MEPAIPTLGQRISIHLFKKCQGLQDRLNQAILNAESTLVIADDIHFDESRLSNSHLLGAPPTTSEHLWQRLKAGSLHYLFVQVSLFVRFHPPLDLTNVSISIHEESFVTSLQRLPAMDITIFLMDPQFSQLTSKFMSFWTSVFKFS
jgi:hypothetical protein